MASFTYFITDPIFDQHYPIWDPQHIEQPDRLKVIREGLVENDVWAKLNFLTSKKADLDDIYLCHPKQFVDELKAVCEGSEEDRKKYCQVHDDIYLTKDTYDAAVVSTGCCLELVKTIYQDPGLNGFALVRPPGHHSYGSVPSGFCFFNNVAICAKKALQMGVKRVIIVDWDVHPGNGTQECIKDVDGVKLISIHSYQNGQVWPYLKETGSESLNQASNTINIPLNQTGLGDYEYLQAFSKIIMPVIFDYQPELILVSCGFDAALGDPEGKMRVTPLCYGIMTELLLSVKAPVAMLMEGGYYLPAVKESACQVVKALTRQNIMDFVHPDLFKKKNPQFLDYINSVFQEVGHQSKMIRKMAILYNCFKYRTFKESIKCLDVDDFKSEHKVTFPFPIENVYQKYSSKVDLKFRKEIENIMKHNTLKICKKRIEFRLIANSIAFQRADSVEFFINCANRDEACFVIGIIVFPNITILKPRDDSYDYCGWINSFTDEKLSTKKFVDDVIAFVKCHDIEI
uniref:Hist_deacetyl domain-containing protein n=1 Tax=Rhabditophanes sp. KR3021 TaxID=114890 RepID=A0AC35U095_9BILA